MRVVVTGLSGAGKSTLARALAAGLGVPHVELDALHWEPGWTPAAPETFVARVSAATEGGAWVADGHYGGVRAMLWARATHLVWLDYERLPIMARVIRRTALRVAARQVLWNGNRESWHSLLDPGHPIRWAWRHWRGRRAAIEALLAGGDYPGLRVIRLRHPSEARPAMLALLREAREAAGRARELDRLSSQASPLGSSDPAPA
jgi:adenylate kinase family enzyme